MLNPRFFSIAHKISRFLTSSTHTHTLQSAFNQSKQNMSLSSNAAAASIAAIWMAPYLPAVVVASQSSKPCSLHMYDDSVSVKGKPDEIVISISWAWPVLQCFATAGVLMAVCASK